MIQELKKYISDEKTNNPNIMADELRLKINNKNFINDFNHPTFQQASEIDYETFGVRGIFWLHAYNYPKEGTNIGNNLTVMSIGIFTFYAMEL